jgi:flagellar motor switch protein FliN/FliY
VSNETSQDGSESAAPGGGALMDLVSDVPLRLTVEIGSARLLLRDVLQLEAGSVVELDRDSGELADILVNGRLVARGDVTAVEDRLAVRIVEVVAGDKK